MTEHRCGSCTACIEVAEIAAQFPCTREPGRINPPYCSTGGCKHAVDDGHCSCQCHDGGVSQ